MNLNTSKHFINQLDQERLIKMFSKYFNFTTSANDIEKMAPLVKEELKQIHSMRRLVLFTGFEIEEFIYHTISIYPHLFNKSFTKKMRRYVNEGFSK